MSRNSWRWLLAILLLATALRFYLVAQIPLRADEATNLYLAADSPAAIIRVFMTDDPHMPLYYLLLHYWMQAAGQSELALRYLAVFAGVLVVPFTYALGKMLFPGSRTIALTGAFLVAINPYLVWDAQEVYMYSMLTVVAVVSFIFFLRVTKPGATWSDWLVYIAANVIGLYLHYLAILIFLAQGVLWLWWSIQRRLSRRTMLSWLAAMVSTFAFFLPWQIMSSAATSFQSDLWQYVNLPEMAWRLVVAFNVGRIDSHLMPSMIDPFVGSALAIIFLLIFLIGLIAKSNDADARVVLGVMLFVPIFVLFAHAILRFPILDERYLLLVIPAFGLLVARGLTQLKTLTRTSWVPSIALVYMVFASGYSLNNYYHAPAFAKSPDWHGFMQELVADARPGDVMIQNYPDPALPYYLNNRMQRVLLPRTNSAMASDVDADLNRLTNKFTRVWFQPSPFSEWDTEGLVATWLDRHARAMNTYPFRGVQLELYLPISEALHQAESINVTFSNRVQLLAFDSDLKLMRSSTLRLTLYWKALEYSERDATVFVHLYDATGKLQGQQDNQPVHGTFPFSQWQSGEAVVDSYALQIPADAPSGKYSLVVGMYDSQTQARLSVASSQIDQLILKSFEVSQ